MAKRKKIDWPVIFEEQKNSGLPIGTFCKSKGVHPTSFHKNKRKHTEKNFVELMPAAGNIQCPDGKSIILKTKGYSIELNNGFNSTILRELLSVLKECG